MLSRLVLLGAFAAFAAAATPNPKRGLVYVPSPDPEINKVWLQPGSPLTWYYNYMWNASEPFASQAPESGFEFVPMMWGAGNVNDTSFLANITSLIKQGHRVEHVLGFNQPDVSYANGGANLSPKDAANLWINNFLPLRQQYGVKLGLPCVQASAEPSNWTIPFLANCSSMLAGKPCDFDFVPIHAFGNMTALTQRIDMFAAAFPGKGIWLTEYALNDKDLDSTQAFFNTSLQYLDNTNVVERYSYFGSFRSDVSNVGPNVTMLDPYNRLTDIGSWYLGGTATGNPPTYSGSGGSSGSGSGSSGSACSASNPCGKGSGAEDRFRGLKASWLGGIVLASALSLRALLA